MTRVAQIVKPDSQELLQLRVVRRERLGRHWARVTFGGGDIDRFTPMGYDQWFRIFLPLGGDAGLARVPAGANRMLGYLKYLQIPDGMRPVMRNYTVRAYRAAGPSGAAEIDVDFVLHGTGPEAGPASRWADAAAVGEHVAIIDEGLRFNPARGTSAVLLVADETAAPAVAGICASLPGAATGVALIEVPSREDVLPFEAPPGVEVRWIVRAERAAPGTAALAALRELPAPPAQTHAFCAGEQALATGARRHLVAGGLDKDRISFIGYWRTGVASPAPRSQRAGAHST